MPKRTSRKLNKSDIGDALLDLHEPIARVRPLAELVHCLADSRDGAPSPVLGIIGQRLYGIDEELRARWEIVRKVRGKRL